MFYLCFDFRDQNNYIFAFIISFKSALYCISLYSIEVDNIQVN